MQLRQGRMRRNMTNHDKARDFRGALLSDQTNSCMLCSDPPPRSKSAQVAVAFALPVGDELRRLPDLEEYHGKHWMTGWWFGTFSIFP